eukprot:g56171.t1
MCRPAHCPSVEPLALYRSSRGTASSCKLTCVQRNLWKYVAYALVVLTFASGLLVALQGQEPFDDSGGRWHKPEGTLLTDDDGDKVVAGASQLVSRVLSGWRSAISPSEELVTAGEDRAKQRTEVDWKRTLGAAPQVAQKLGLATVAYELLSKVGSASNKQGSTAESSLEPVCPVYYSKSLRWQLTN